MLPIRLRLKGQGLSALGHDEKNSQRAHLVRLVSIGVVTLLKKDHENFVLLAFSSDRGCLAPNVHSRRTKGSVRSCRNEMTLDIESVVGGCVS